MESMGGKKQRCAYLTLRVEVCASSLSWFVHRSLQGEISAYLASEPYAAAPAADAVPLRGAAST